MKNTKNNILLKSGVRSSASHEPLAAAGPVNILSGPIVCHCTVTVPGCTLLDGTAAPVVSLRK